MGMTVYLPALALNALTPLTLNWSIALTSGICTFYTCVVKKYLYTSIQLLYHSLFICAFNCYLNVYSVIETKSSKTSLETYDNVRRTNITTTNRTTRART